MNTELLLYREEVKEPYNNELHVFNAGNDLVLLTGNSNVPLAKQVAGHIGCTLDEPVDYFGSGDPRIMIEENIRGRDVVILESGAPDPRGHFTDLLFTISAAKRARAGKIEVVNPYGFFTRQDRKSRPREGISAADALFLMQQAGASGFMQLDMHAAATMGAVQIPVDNLFASHMYLSKILEWELDNMMLVSPDMGGGVRVNKIADKIAEMTGKRPDIATLYKHRDPEGGKTDVQGLMGEVKGRNCVVIDDMFDTCGTFVGSLEYLLDQCDASSVSAAATHGVFSDNGLQKLHNSRVHRFLYTNTIDSPLPKQMEDKGQVVDISEMLATAIVANQTGESLAKMFF